MTFKPQHFELYEFLPKSFYEQWYPVHGEKLWRLFPYELLWTADELRAKHGRMIGNDWYWRKGDPDANQYRGYRPFYCHVGAKLSDHKFFRAFDPMPIDTTADAIRWDCLQHPHETPYKYITVIEEDVPWFHYSVGNHNKKLEGIRVI